MRYTLYSVNDWLDDEEALEVARREQYRALDDGSYKSVEVEIESVHDRKRMTTDHVQNLAMVIIVIFFILAILAWRR